MKKISSINKNNNFLRSNSSIWITLSLLFGMILLFGIAEVFIPHNHDPIVNRTHEAKSTPAIESTVNRISSKFICACGECSGEALHICKCKYAVRERKMIRDLVIRETTEEEIVKAINTKFGGLKKTL
ncbi:MAG: hypothetical protein KF816_08545 [Melioribacteraceae bacterium]|nr:hypothetical protein [Melioribacteraceae bacterium]